MSAQPVYAFERRKAKDDDSTVAAAGDENRVGKLELTDERGVALQ